MAFSFVYTVGRKFKFNNVNDNLGRTNRVKLIDKHIINHIQFGRGGGVDLNFP